MSRWKAMARGALGVVLVTACGGGPRPPPAPDPDACRQQIAARMLEIRELVEEIDLATSSIDPDPRRVRECQVRPACHDPCLQSDRVCDLAREVCALAPECLRDDPWANEQCSTAREACNGGFTSCCDACDAAP